MISFVSQGEARFIKGIPAIGAGFARRPWQLATHDEPRLVDFAMSLECHACSGSGTWL